MMYQIKSFWQQTIKSRLVLIVLFGTLNVFSQFSKAHYIPPVSNSDSQVPQGQSMYISCPSTTPIAFTITKIGGQVISGTTSRDNPFVYNLGSGIDTQMLIKSDDVGSIKHNKGFIIEAEDLVYVTVRLTSTPQNYQAGSIVSKGLAALGTHYRIGAFINTGVANTSDNHYTFATILATENNTTVSYADIKQGVVLINNAAAGSKPAPVVLNRGDSFAIAVKGPTQANKDGLIGASITSDKPIAVNCGSFAGSNGNSSNMDLGMDQIVSAERTGQEYIFIKGNGLDVMERPLIVAHEDNTEVRLHGVATPVATLNAGQYLALSGTNFSSNGNLYVQTSKNVFAYQGIGGTNQQANQNMHFVPPLSCQTPKIINNIPKINEVSDLTDFTASIFIVTETNADLSFIIDGVSYTFANLPYTKLGPFPVMGNSNFVTYKIEGLTGNVSAISTKQVYLSYFGSSGAATYGGFYSGFTFTPEVALNKISITQSNCIPNVLLNVNSLSPFDNFQWYQNNVALPNETNPSYQPTTPGYYHVSAVIDGCNVPNLVSDDIPVSNCADDSDADGTNDNIDLDLDQDGITNCMESFGDLNLDLSQLNTPITINQNTFSNTYTTTIATFNNTGTPGNLVGNNQGTFVSHVVTGKGNSLTYTIQNMTQPMSVSLEYVNNANTNDLLNDGAEFRLISPTDKTITVLNPTDQLLIDTNYDGIYDSGITQFSSFEIRFKLNSNVPLAPGTGTFSFKTNQTDSLIFKHINLSDTQDNKATFVIKATCVPKDTDADGIADALDFDSDNDGITDFIEAQGETSLTLTHLDTNQDGIDNVFGNGLIPANTDADAVIDALDLDADNDGIYDLVESGSTAIDANLNGIIDGNAASFGANGLSNSVETAPESGLLNYTLANIDADNLWNFIDLDADGDGCFDVVEAGFADPNHDGLLGNTAPPIVSGQGVVTSGTGYTTPQANYAIAAPITITTQPLAFTSCEMQEATFSVVTNAVTSYQWEVSTNGGISWTAVANSTSISGANTNTLHLNPVLPSMSGWKYRVFINKNGNTCGLYSNEVLLTTYSMPVLTSPIELKQCDNDTPDGFAPFNLTEINSLISANANNETFSYFTTFDGANTNDVSVQINNPTAYISSNNGVVFVRVQNANLCYKIAELHLTVTVTQINIATGHQDFTKCDDEVAGISTAIDGFAMFDFSAHKTFIEGQLPTPLSHYIIKYYASEADASAEQNPITDISHFRNTMAHLQQIYLRVDSIIDNGCFAFGPFVTLHVEALPVVHPLNATNTIRQCDNNNDGAENFDITHLESTILAGQTNKTFTYFDAANNPITLTNPLLVNGSKTIKVHLANTNSEASDGPCFDEALITFIVDQKPIINPLNWSDFEKCDNETDPLSQNGTYPFDLSNVANTILGNQTGMSIQLFDANNQLITNLNSPFESGTQNIKIVVTNNLNPICMATSILPLKVYSKPKIKTTDYAKICLNRPNDVALINAGLQDGSPESNYTYKWYYNNTLLPNTTYSINASLTGEYRVEVSSTHCNSTRTIYIDASDIAHIQSINITDLTDTNTVEVVVTGVGSYLYALDNENNYQLLPFFSPVASGPHIVYIKDIKNDCGVVKKDITVLEIPKFFSPNGDGINDTWQIKGISSKYYPHAMIYIFDRYGKLIYQVLPNAIGWDGTFNGQPLPADDYWFTIQLDDGRQTKGHFSIIR
ncbi:T9SS type B sorting domain-containing protein [Flavobacterium branchiophilum]|uniref:Gliding motility protein n=1 Tax=Flavobacterium branchiophilum TaxID=55197 RepID=A0A2H3KE08_9FLAO|nr:T9SS type B sorting domain-containing protein [Flavobacterium branchiophilum]PDS26314.1 gliding motility protein [Flavobacterium branchiophilum]